MSLRTTLLRSAVSGVTALALVGGGLVAAAPAQAAESDQSLLAGLLAPLLPDQALRTCVADEAVDQGLLGGLTGVLVRTLSGLGLTNLLRGILGDVSGAVDCASQGIESLVGLGALDGIVSIDLSGNSIVDLSPLAPLLGGGTTVIATGQVIELGAVALGATITIPIPKGIDGLPVDLIIPSGVTAVIDALHSTVTFVSGAGTATLTWVSGTFTGLLTALLQGAPQPAGGTPTIAGDARVGSTLTADPQTNGEALSVAYQWLRIAGGASTDIAGATDPTYAVVVADRLARLAVRVVVEVDGKQTSTTTSAPTDYVASGAFTGAAVAISGTPAVGSDLTAETGSWSPRPAFVYAWLRDGARIVGARSAVYRLVDADAGATIQVRVTGSADGYTTLAVTSAATARIAAAATSDGGTGGTAGASVQQVPTAAPGSTAKATALRIFARVTKPTVSGTARVGRKLTAKLTHWNAKTRFGYVWLRDGKAIAKAKNKTYVLTAKDRGHRIAVRVTARLTGYQSVVVRSAPTTRIVR